MNKTDPIARARNARKEISEENGNDIERLVRYYVELQARHSERIVDYGSNSDDSPSQTRILKAE